MGAGSGRTPGPDAKLCRHASEALSLRLGLRLNWSLHSTAARAPGDEAAALHYFGTESSTPVLALDRDSAATLLDRSLGGPGDPRCGFEDGPLERAALEPLLRELAQILAPWSSARDEGERHAIELRFTARSLAFRVAL